MYVQGRKAAPGIPDRLGTVFLSVFESCKQMTQFRVARGNTGCSPRVWCVVVEGAQRTCLGADAEREAGLHCSELASAVPFPQRVESTW